MVIFFPEFCSFSALQSTSWWEAPTTPNLNLGLNFTPTTSWLQPSIWTEAPPVQFLTLAFPEVGPVVNNSISEFGGGWKTLRFVTTFSRPKTMFRAAPVVTHWASDWDGTKDGKNIVSFTVFLSPSMTTPLDVDWNIRDSSRLSSPVIEIVGRCVIMLVRLLWFPVQIIEL